MRCVKHVKAVAGYAMCSSVETSEQFGMSQRYSQSGEGGRAKVLAITDVLYVEQCTHGHEQTTAQTAGLI